MTIRAIVGTALAAVMLLPAGALAQHPVGNPAPRITVKSPKSRTYKVGTTLKFRYSCIAAKRSKATACKGTLRSRGHKPRSVKNGTKICFTHAGTYMLKISTRDNRHHFQYQTFAFRIK